ncbi:MAG: phosphodiester glycosidase family protein [Bacteroidales bacterium]|nr:phosphodiester glycosidase family protein [Bacteroidales bacterium]
MEIRMHQLLGLGLVLVALAACKKEQPDGFYYEPQSVVGQKLVQNNVCGVYKDTTFLITPGVEESDLNILMNDGTRQIIYLVCADISRPGVSMRVMRQQAAGWTLKTPRALAEEFSVPGERIVATTNGDYWSSGNMPRGPVRMGWAVYQDVFNVDANDPQQAIGFVGINSLGNMMIAERDRYDSVKSTLKECTGCGVLLVQNGQIRDYPQWTALQPRTAIGMTSDGKVYMLVGEGRSRNDGSRDRWEARGLAYSHMSAIFKALGCKDAACLDGGGSSQLIIRNPVSRTWQLRNQSAQAGGTERPVANAWAVTVDEP